MVLIRRLVDYHSPFNKTSATWKTKTGSQSHPFTSNPTPIARQRATLGGQAFACTTCFSWGSFQFSGLVVRSSGFVMQTPAVMETVCHLLMSTLSWGNDPRWILFSSYVETTKSKDTNVGIRTFFEIRFGLSLLEQSLVVSGQGAISHQSLA